MDLKDRRRQQSEKQRNASQKVSLGFRKVPPPALLVHTKIKGGKGEVHSESQNSVAAAAAIKIVLTSMALASQSGLHNVA